MSRKWIWLCAFVALFTVGYAVRGPAVSQFFQWYLKGYCKECLGSRLTYEAIRHDNGKWIFENPVLTTPNRLEKGGYSCQAEKASIEVSISWLKRSLNLEVAVQNPQVDVGAGAEDIKAILSKPSHSFHLFDVHMRFNIPQGIILVHDFTQDHLVPIPLFFSIDLSCKQKKEGCMTIWLGGPEREGQDFLAVFSQPRSLNPQLHVNFNNIDLPSFQHVIKGLWPQLSPFHIDEGLLSGNVVFSFPQHADPYAEGKINGKDLKALHPELSAAIAIPNLSFHLTSKESLHEEERIFHTIGCLDVPLAQLIMMKEGQPFWTIDGIGGELLFQTHDDVKFTIGGHVSSPQNKRELVVEGRSRFAEKGQTNFSIDVGLLGRHPDEETTLHFSARQLGEHWSFGEVELTGFGKEELALLQHIAGTGSPQWQQLHIDRGNVDAAALVYLKGLQLTEVKVERIAVNNLQFDFPPWTLSGSVDSGVGSLSFDLFADEPLKTLNADLNIRQGSLNLEGLDKAKWEFAGIHSDISISKGIVQKSLLKGTMAGLDGEIVLDGTASGPMVAFHFHGLAADLAQVLPEPIRKGMSKEFKDDGLNIYAEAAKVADGLQFKGRAFVEGADGKEEKIAFGFTLEQSSTGLWRRWPPHPVAAEYCPGAGFEAMRKMAPSIAMPVNIVYRHLIKKELGYGGFGIKGGWFHAEDLPMEKYLSPFLFSKDQMKLSGLGNFRGDFDGQKLVVHYDAKDMVVENDDFCAEIPHIGPGTTSEPQQLIATFLYDFDQHTSFNAFPIRNGTYFEKNTGLLFTEINADVSMENALAHLSDLNVFSNGLYFEGTIDLDWSMPGDGVFDVAVNIQEMYGKISHTKHFLSHINKNILMLKIPLEGNISLQKKGAKLLFSFYDGGYAFDTLFPGVLTDGSIKGENVDMSLHELSFNFDYDHKGNTLNFSDVQAMLLVGKPNHIEEYAVKGNRLCFTDYKNNQIDFDLWAGDKKRNIIRVAGHTTSENSMGDEPFITFHFDRYLSHFGNVNPSAFELVLKDWSQAEVFKLEFEFKLQHLLADLQRFSRTGLFFLSRSMLKELNDITTARGDLHASINYDGQRSVMQYQIAGSSVGVGNQSFDKFLLSGTKKDSLWSIDQLQLDDISVACDVLKEGSNWKINFLGARLGDSLLIGLEGQYRDDDSHLDAKINLLEANLADLSQWPSLQEVLGGQRITGQVRATGILFADFDKTLPRGMRFDTKMAGSFTNGSIKGFLLQDIPNAAFHYNSENGFSLHEVSTALKSINNEVQAGVFIQKAAYDFAKKELQVQGLHFDIPASNLEWVSRHLQANFSSLITDVVADNIRHLKGRGIVQGVFDATMAGQQSACRIRLIDGLYTLMGKEHDIKNFVLEYNPYALTVSADYRYRRYLCRVEAKTVAPYFNSGEIVLSNAAQLPGQRPQMPLIVHWTRDPQAGFYIQKMTGTLCGMNFDLIRNQDAALSTDALYLSGRVDVNMRQVAPMLDERLAGHILNWELGDGYAFQGQWNIMKDEAKPFDDNITFHGELLGRDFEFMGYRLYNLYSQLTYTPQASYIRNLVINDSCGTAQIDQIDFLYDGANWHASSPEFVMSDFRPSILRQARSTSPPPAKSLLIRNLTVSNVQGVLGDRNSFTGDGQLSFVNPPKKNLQHTIFAIPAELLTRIGLDMAVLTPVRGSVFFDIRDGKAVVTRFKDVYSKGRVSKFNLAHNGYESYVDFDGNVNMQIRMRQYNLVFKLAELFTVTVQGTLKKPTYALQKQYAGEKEKQITASQ